MNLRRTLLAAALVSSFAAILLATTLQGTPLSSNSVDTDARSWAAAPLLAFAILGTAGCLVGALTVRR